MTTDIDKLEGRELDTLIHRRLFERDVVYAPYPGQAIDSLPRYFRYPADPAAMILMENEIEQRGLQHEYSVLLAMVVWRDRAWTWVDWRDTWAIIRATPMQRCRAALKAVGEGKK